ncbi:hypothetical protein HanRHA438_Chr09g0390761 [Helianthus annuus]|nr:hypothetical protein HanRHA438_Chr09g0390761 [Helianthus annuus]
MTRDHHFRHICIRFQQTSTQWKQSRGQQMQTDQGSFSGSSCTEEPNSSGSTGSSNVLTEMPTSLIAPKPKANHFFYLYYVGTNLAGQCTSRTRATYPLRKLANQRLRSTTTQQFFFLSCHQTGFGPHLKLRSTYRNLTVAHLDDGIEHHSTHFYLWSVFRTLNRLQLPCNCKG